MKLKKKQGKLEYSLKRFEICRIWKMGWLPLTKKHLSLKASTRNGILSASFYEAQRKGTETQKTKTCPLILVFI